MGRTSFSVTKTCVVLLQFGHIIKPRKVLRHEVRKSRQNLLTQLPLSFEPALSLTSAQKAVC